MKRSSFRRVCGGIFTAALLWTTACAVDRDKIPKEGVLSEHDRLCHSASTAHPLPQLEYLGRPGVNTLTFNTLRESVNSACKTCHLNNSSNTGATRGGFTYVDEYEDVTVSDGTVLPGLKSVAERMSEAISKAAMPPAGIRKQNPDAFLKIGLQLQAWTQAGKPSGAFQMGTADPGPPLDPKMIAGTDLGDCTPQAELVKSDYRRDRIFSLQNQLPDSLSDTDLFSLDSYELAKKGTVSYNVEYPLWADNAEKGRYVHVPSKIGLDLKLHPQSIHFNSQTRKFEIPANTRFYKTFFKAVKMADGKTVRYRKVETRVIVVRYPYEKSLFGTYRWDDAEQSARLVDTPYRDGSAWKDSIFDIQTDPKKNTFRKYVIPAKHRCLECHMGSESQSFVLGFTPLQINRRMQDGEVRLDPVGPDDLTQVKRLIDYKVIDGIGDAEDLPKLERVVSVNPPRNIFEVRAQGYMVGNCAHCHNPDGYALKVGGVALKLAAGDIYGFDTFQTSKLDGQASYRIVSHDGDVTQSYLYDKLARPIEQLGGYGQMPLHTPGLPNCESLRLIGKWIKTFTPDTGIIEAMTFEPDECKSAPDQFPWIDQDLTWPDTGDYQPRRPDWNDRSSPDAGMPQRYRDLAWTDGLDQLSKSRIPSGSWIKTGKENLCRFPDVQALPADKQRDWMYKDPDHKTPKVTLGEIYSSRPGAYFFTNTCVKCHGNRGEGDGQFAKTIYTYSGGSIRVANFQKELFGNSGKNLDLFSSVDAQGKTKNLAGNYLVWMAMEGTKVDFPPAVAGIVGEHKGQMLRQIRDRCARFIPTAQQVSKKSQPAYEVFYKVCTYNNADPRSPELQFDVDGKPLNETALNAWLDRGAMNAGWMIYDYLKDAIIGGKWEPAMDECEKVFPSGNGS